ncbi:MAG TPA: cytochrome c maturation protein CcmE [Acidimicrobiales bacterium]
MAVATRRRTSRRTWVVIVVVLAAIGYLAWQGIGNATLYFYNADEAVARRDELGDRRFRVQGTVVDGSVVETGAAVDFTIEFAGTTVPVHHVGDPPELFQPGIPVVLEGHWDGERFASDQIMVKHSSEYKAENPDRVEPGAP